MRSAIVAARTLVSNRPSKNVRTVTTYLAAERARAASWSITTATVSPRRPRSIGESCRCNVGRRHFAISNDAITASVACRRDDTRGDVCAKFELTRASSPPNRTTRPKPRTREKYSQQPCGQVELCSQESEKNCRYLTRPDERPHFGSNRARESGIVAQARLGSSREPIVNLQHCQATAKTCPLFPNSSSARSTDGSSKEEIRGGAACRNTRHAGSASIRNRRASVRGS